MDTPFPQKSSALTLGTLDLDPKSIEEFPLFDFLTLCRDRISYLVEAIMSGLQSETDVDEDLMNVIKLVNAAERVQMHLDFTLDVLGTSSDTEVEKVKAKFSSISEPYEKIKSKEDIAHIPLKYMINIIHDKIIVGLAKLSKDYFKDDGYEQQFQRTTENISKTKIYAARFTIADLHYPLCLTFPKHDIFCYPKTSTIWEDIYQCATFKKLVTQQEVKASFKLTHAFLRLGHIIAHKFNDFKECSHLETTLGLLQEIIYYGTQTGKAETQALVQYINPTMEEAFKVLNITESPFVSSFLLLGSTVVGNDEIINVPKLFPQITREVIQKEYQENTFNKIHPIDRPLLKGPDQAQARNEVISELFVESENKVKIRLLAPEHLGLKGELSTLKSIQQKVLSFMDEDEDVKSEGMEEAILVHIHGGGFVSGSSSTHRVYLKQWVKKLKITHFSIDYRLAPKNQYPDGLDDVWQAYLWIINYAESILGIKNKKVIIAGDSAGANLALALSLRLIRAGHEPPVGCLLMYPCLSVDALSSSPSYLTSVDDHMLPSSLLKLVAKAYVPEGFKNMEDPFISPMVASDELLEKLPPIRIVAGTDDPLYDDNWRLISKLRKLKRDVKIIVHEHLPHAFLCNPSLKIFPQLIDEACDLVRELVSLSNQQNLGNEKQNAVDSEKQTN